MTPMATAIAMDNGLNIATYTGPFTRKAQVWIVLFKDEPNIPWVMQCISFHRTWTEVAKHLV